MCLVAPALDSVDNAALDVHQAPHVSECGKPWAELMNFLWFITAPPPNNPIPPTPTPSPEPDFAVWESLSRVRSLFLHILWE